MAKAKRARPRSNSSGRTAPVTNDGHRIIQTRVPVELYQRIRIAAKEETISMAAYVRRTLKNTVPGG